MIDPSISPEGEDYLEYNKKRWGVIHGQCR